MKRSQWILAVIVAVISHLPFASAANKLVIADNSDNKQYPNACGDCMPCVDACAVIGVQACADVGAAACPNGYPAAACMPKGGCANETNSYVCCAP